MWPDNRGRTVLCQLSIHHVHHTNFLVMVHSSRYLTNTHIHTHTHTHTWKCCQLRICLCMYANENSQVLCRTGTQKKDVAYISIGTNNLCTFNCISVAVSCVYHIFISTPNLNNLQSFALCGQSSWMCDVTLNVRPLLRMVLICQHTHTHTHTHTQTHMRTHTASLICSILVHNSTLSKAV